MVVIPQKASEREKFAASELKKYLKMICNVDSVITLDADYVSGQSILIGGPERNVITKKYISEAEFDKIVPGPEGIFIKSYDDCLKKNNLDYNGLVLLSGLSRQQQLAFKLER